MLQTVKDYVTWGEISKEVLETLGANLKPRGKKIKYFNLHPPKGGFRKSIKWHFPKGELGYRGKRIDDLVLRMLPPGSKQ